MDKVRTSSSLWRNHGFQLLTLGYFVENLTTRGVEFVLPLMALMITRDAATMGIVAAAGALGMLVAGLPGGVMADRWNRKYLLVGSGIANAIAVGSLIAAFIFNVPSVAHMCLVAGFIGAANSLASSASTSAVRSLVAPEDFASAGSINQVRHSIAGLASAPVAGLLLSISRCFPLISGVVGSCVAAICCWLIPHPLGSVQQENTSQPSFWKDLATGLRFIMKSSLLTGILLLGVIINFAFTGGLFSVLTDRTLAGWSEAQLGLLNSAVAIGMLTGALLSSRLLKLLSGRDLIIATTVLAVGCFTIAAFNRGFWLTLMMVALAGFMLPAANVATMTYQMLITPVFHQGRVEASMNVAAQVIAPVAPVVVGIMVSHWSPAIAITFFACCFVAVPLVSSFVSEIRNMPKLSVLNERLCNGETDLDLNG